MISVPVDPPIYWDDDDYILEEDNTEEIKKDKSLLKKIIDGSVGYVRVKDPLIIHDSGKKTP
jgi:hypothetical protein